MPYEIIKSTAGSKHGYRVRKEGTNDYFSKEALPLDIAKKQRTAIAISETKRKDVMKMTNGGIVPNPKRYKPIEGRSRDYGDVVGAILEPGELVIPVEHTKKVTKFLKNNNIKLPGI